MFGGVTDTDCERLTKRHINGTCSVIGSCQYWRKMNIKHGDMKRQVYVMEHRGEIDTPQYLLLCVLRKRM